MKNSLCFIYGIVFIFLSGIPLLSHCQTVLFSEDFSGFIGGSHSSPSTSDVSGSLDAKTLIPGWSGSLIYPAAGEIKVGTSTSTGWIETPPLNFSESGASIIIKFDIARWTNDATTIRVYLDETELGDMITPSDNFQTIQLSASKIQTSCKIKIKGLTKRFYLDNLIVLTGDIPTGEQLPVPGPINLKIYPVPVSSELTLINDNFWDIVEILDLNGKVLLTTNTDGERLVKIDVGNLGKGFYLIRCQNDKTRVLKKFIKAIN